ncbi:MAG: type III pantothenate kinase [Chloroflexi bacterium]|nr:type III pantothenate kinase [Chloroflexota bacterium]
MDTLFAVDIGNTNVTLGVFEGDHLRATGRISTDPNRTEDELALLMAGLLNARGVTPEQLDAVAMCSVVPPLTQMVRHAIADLTGIDALVVGPGVKTGIRISYDRTQDVGTDRIVDAVAAITLYGKPTIVVDIGTATVFDAINEDGEYVGGAIAPGLRLAAEALYTRTAQLRRVELIAPETAIGRSTVTAMQSGLIFGYVELIEGMVRRIKSELSPGEPEACKVIATGGLAVVFEPLTQVFDVLDEDLTLKGLRIVHEMNR